MIKGAIIVLIGKNGSVHDDWEPHEESNGYALTQQDLEQALREAFEFGFRQSLLNAGVVELATLTELYIKDLLKEKK